MDANENYRLLLADAFDASLQLSIIFQQLFIVVKIMLFLRKN